MGNEVCVDCCFVINRQQADCFVVSVSSVRFSIADLLNGLQLESVSLLCLTALTFIVLQSMESFSSSRPIDRTGHDDMEVLSEER